MASRDSFGLCVVVACCLHGALAVAEEPAKLTQEQRNELTATRAKLLKEAAEHDAQGRTLQAIAAAEQLVAAERRLFGEHLNIAERWIWIADRYERLENFAAAQRARQAVFDIKSRLLEKDHWQVTDARATLKSTELLTSLSANDRRQLAQARLRDADARRLYGQAKYAESMQALAEMGDVLKRLLGETHPEYVNNLNNQAEIYAGIGDYAKALPMCRQALELQKQAVGEFHPLYALTLGTLAALYQRMGEYARAEPLYRQTLEIVKKTQGETHPNYGKNLSNLALLYQVTGDYAQAEALSRQAVEVGKKVLGEAHPEYATSLNNLAMLYQAKGDRARAEPLFHEALAVQKKALGEMHPLYATGLHNLGLFYESIADLPRAEPLYREAAEIFKKSLGEKHPDYATSLNGLATLYRNMGDFARAELLYRQALEIAKESVGEGHLLYGSSVDGLAGLYRFMGEYARAELFYRQALEITKKAVGETHPAYAESLSNLAGVYQLRGNYARAEPLYRQALEIIKKTLGETHPDYAKGLNDLARLYVSQEDYAQAEPLYRQTMEIWKKALSEQHPYYGATLNNLAFLYMAKGDYAQAEPLCRQALVISRKSLDLAALVQSERQQLAMTAGTRFYFDSYLSLALEAGDFQTAAYEHLLSWKGMMGGRQRAVRRAMMEPRLASQFAQLEAVARDLGRQAFATPPPSEQAAWQRRVEELSDRLERLQADLAGASATYRAAVGEVTLADLRTALADNILVDFVEFRHFRPDKTAKGKQRPEQRLAAFVVRREGALEVIDLGPVAPISSAVDKWREGFGQTAESQKAAQTLREKIWEPVERILALDASRSGSSTNHPAPSSKGMATTADRMAAPRNILISPDGPLSRFPLSALPGKEAGTYLLEEWPISIIPAPHALVTGTRIDSDIARSTAGAASATAIDAAGPPNKRTAMGNLLTLGGIDYDADLAAALTAPTAESAPRVFGRHRAPRSEGGLQFDFLSGSRGELATIKDLYGKSFGQTGLTALDAARASEEAFRREAPRHLYLHVATHGFFAPATVKSFLSRGTHEASPASENLVSGQTLAGYHPNLLSGLALAGANKPPATGDDGILTAEEVQALDLRGVELVVLSACETGLGARAGGEGVLGLQRAFQVAGAKTVIASLWKVDDVATRDLMERFYDTLWNRKHADGRPYGTLEALRESQLWMMKERGARGLVPAKEAGVTGQESEGKRLPPYFWAAFVLSGEWR